MLVCLSAYKDGISAAAENTLVESCRTRLQLLLQDSHQSQALQAAQLRMKSAPDCQLFLWDFMSYAIKCTSGAVARDEPDGKPARQCNRLANLGAYRMCRLSYIPGDSQAPGTEGGMWRKWVEMYSACTASSSSPSSVRSSSTVCPALTAYSARKRKVLMVRRILAHLLADCYSLIASFSALKLESVPFDCA